MNKFTVDLATQNVALVGVTLSLLGAVAVGVTWHVSAQIAALEQRMEHKITNTLTRAKKHADEGRAYKFGSDDFEREIRLRDELDHKRAERLRGLEKLMHVATDSVDSYKRWTHKLSERQIVDKQTQSTLKALFDAHVAEMGLIQAEVVKIGNAQDGVMQAVSGIERELKVRNRMQTPSYPLLAPGAAER